MAKRKSGPTFYAVARGRKAGVYATWDECKAQVDGFPGAKHKSFGDQSAAEQFIRETNATLPLPTSKIDSVSKESKSKASEVRERPSSSKANGTKTAALKTAQLDDSSSKDAFTSSGVRIVRAYTDGASSSNGRESARAGWGVHFPQGSSNPDSDLHGLDESKRLPGKLQTNNRAELMAIIRAIQLNPDPEAQLEIYSDSQYSIKAIQEWQHTWRKNKWKRGVGKDRVDVLNRDLIRLLEVEMRGCKHRPILIKVKGHSSDKGNAEADRLAVLGATLPDIPEDEWRDLEPDPSDDEGSGREVKRTKTASLMSFGFVSKGADKK